MANRKHLLGIFYRSWSLLLVLSQQEYSQVEGQSLEAQHTLCTNAATVEYVRWVPSWTRALQMGSFDGCAASELILTASDWTQRSLSFSEASDLQSFEEGCGPVVLTVAPPMAICGYRFQTANASELRDPVSFALHGSVDASNWLILDEELDYNTSTSRMDRSNLFATDFRNINVSLEVPVQIVVFSTYASRDWTHAGHIPADLYAIHQLQLMAGGAVLDLYEAMVETGPNFYVESWGSSTTTSISTTSTTGSNTTRTTSSTTVSLSSITTSSSTASSTISSTVSSTSSTSLSTTTSSTSSSTASSTSSTTSGTSMTTTWTNWTWTYWTYTTESWTTRTWTTLTWTTATMTTSTVTSFTSTSTRSTTSTSFTTSTATTTTSTSTTSSTMTTSTSITNSTTSSTSSKTSRTSSSMTTTTGSSTSTSTTSSSTWRNSTDGILSYLRVELSSPVTLQAFRYITSQQSIDRDPVQFALWGSADNGSSWIPLFFQNETTAVPTTRGAPTAWYAVSTTTTTTPSQDEAVRNALANLEESKLAFLNLLDGLNTSGNGVLAQRVEVQADGVILVGVAMVPSANGEPLGFSYGEVSVDVPSAILESVGVPAVAVLGLVPSSSGLFSLLNSSNGADGGLQSDVLSLDLFADGNAVKDLVQPIQLSMSSNPEQPTGCAFLNEALNEWSQAGLSRVSLDNGTLVCATNHLSIFAAILDSAFAALACSNAAAIYSLKGFQSLGSRVWIIETAAVLNWITLLVGVVLLLRARKEDNKYQAALEEINIIKSLKHRQHTVEGEHHDHDEHVSLKAAVLDELHHFIDGGLVRMAYSRMLRARTGLTLKDLTKLYNQSGHSSVHTRAEQFLKDFEERHVARRISFWYRMNCIWFSVLQPSAASSCLVRTSVLVGKIYSGWAVSAVFYGATSIAPGEEAGCTPAEGAFDIFIRSLVVQLISSAFGALPFIALVLFFYKLTKIRLAVRRAIFWSFLSCYNLFCMLTIAIFIASVSQVDANKWFYTSLIDLILTWIVPIMLIAGIVVVVSFYWMRGEEHHKGGHEQALHPVLPWPALGVLPTYEVKMGSLEVVEKGTKKRKPFIVRCEVGGWPETCQTFERMHGDDAYRVAQGVYNISYNQVLLFSVYHRKGKMPPKLRGRAFIPASDFLEDGLNGKLPLQLNNRSAHMTLHVFLHKPKRPEVPAFIPAPLPSDIHFKFTDSDTDPALSPVLSQEQEKVLEKLEDNKPEEDSVMINVEEEHEASPEPEEEEQASAEPEVSAQLRVLVDLENEDEDAAVPIEPPALCARGNVLAMAHTLTETDDLITMDVDALANFPPAPLMASAAPEPLEPAAPGGVGMVPLLPDRGSTSSVSSAAEEMEVEPIQEAMLHEEMDRLSIPSASRSSQGSTALPTRRAPAGPTREEVVSKVEDSELRNLCSISEQRQLEALPTARGEAT